MSLENLMAEDLSKTLGGKNKLGVMPMPVRTTPIAPAPAAVNPLIDAPAKAPATAKAPAPEQTAPAIQSQPNTDRAERIRQRAASYPERPSGASQYLGSGNTWRLERAQKEIDLEDQKAAAREHLSWAGDSFVARNAQLGLRGVVDMGLGIKALAQHAVGSDEKAQETMQKIGERAKTSQELSYGIVTSFDEAMTKGGFWNWVGSSILQQLPNMAASVASSGIGGLVGGATRPIVGAEVKAAGKNIISRSIADAVKKETARQIALKRAAGKAVSESVAKNVAEKIVRTNIGQQIGAFASGMALNTGENVTELYNRTEKFNTVGSLTAGAVKGALDSLFTSRTAGKLFNPGSASRAAINEFNKSNSKFVLGVLGGILKDSGIEGTTEGLQYLVDEFTVYAQKPENYDKKPEQIWTEFLDNAAAAAVSSMALSSVSTYKDESAKRAEAREFSTAQSTVPAVDPNAPAVNPLLNPEAMSGPSVFDATMIPPQSPAMDPEAAQEPINPILATPKPTANEEDANIVRKAMSARGPKFAAIQAVDPVPSAATAAVKEVSDKFGIRTIWVSGPTIDGMAVQGAVVGDAPVLLLNTDLLTNSRRDPVMMVYAHELTHRSERVDAKQYAVLEEAVLAMPGAQDGIARRVAAGMSEAEARSEAVAEQVEVLGTDQAFWREVFQGKDQSFIEHIIQIITEMADRVFGTNDAAKADAIRGAAVAAFQSLANQNQTTTTEAEVAAIPDEAIREAPEYLGYRQSGMNDADAISAVREEAAETIKRPAQAGIKVGGQNGYEAAYLTQPGESPNTFNGQNLSEIRSPTGAAVRTKFYTEQGSEYIMAEDGSTRRIKSSHGNTGGEDTGLHGWSERAIFTRGQEGTDFNNGAGNLISNKKRIKVVVQDNRVGVLIYDVNSKAWRQATYADAFPTAVRTGIRDGNKNLTAESSEKPEVGTHILEFDSRADGSTKSVHPGSDVSHVEKPVQPQQEKTTVAPVVASETPSGETQTPLPSTDETQPTEKKGTSNGQVQGQAQEVAQAIEPMAADVAQATAAKPAPEAQAISRQFGAKPISDEALYTAWSGRVSNGVPISVRDIERSYLVADGKRTVEQTVEWLKIQGYVREGDRYVFRGEAKPAPEAKPAAPEGEALVSADQAELMRQRAQESARAKEAMRKAKQESLKEQRKMRREGTMTRAEAGKQRRMHDFDRGDTPVLNAVIDGFGGISSESAKAVEIERESLPASIRDRLFPSNGRGSDWNSILWAIENDNLIPGVTRADEVGTRIAKEIKSIQRRYADEKAEAQEAKQAELDFNAFNKAVLSPYDGVAFKSTADKLNAGDVIVREVMGEPVRFTVTEILDEGGVVLKSKAYGEQAIDAFDVVHADEYIPAQVGEAELGAEDVPFSAKPERTPFGTEVRNDGKRDASDVLFSAKQVSAEEVEATARRKPSERQYSINRFFREELDRDVRATYQQKSINEMFSELSAVEQKHGYDWIEEHLHDLSKESLEEFPLRLRNLAGRKILLSYEKLFRSQGVNDDGSNMPADFQMEEMWNRMERLRKEASGFEKEGGQGHAVLAGTYSQNRMASPVEVRKTVNRIHDEVAQRNLGGMKPEVDKLTAELKKANEELISSLEAERKKNAESEEQLAMMEKALKTRVKQTASRVSKSLETNAEYRASVASGMADVFNRLKAFGADISSLSARPQMDVAVDMVRAHVYLHNDTDAISVRTFLKQKGIDITERTALAMVNDALVFIDGLGRKAPAAGASKTRQAKRAATKKQEVKQGGPYRTPDLTIQGPTGGEQQTLGIGEQKKVLGSPNLIFGEGDARRLALELDEAGQTLMRGITSNIETVVMNALKHGRNRAGIEAKLVEAGVDRNTASRIAKIAAKQREAAIIPTLDQIRDRYAKRGTKTGRAVSSAMDRIMNAMRMADAANSPSVAGFFDGNAWDESRQIIEEAFGFKGKITREWFDETMRMYREYEKADLDGNHIKSSVLHKDMLLRVARVRHEGGISGLWNVIRSFVTSGMLANPATHAWNLVNTGSRNIEYAKILSEMSLWKAISEKNIDYARFAFAPWEIMLRSHKQALGVAKYILKTGVNPLTMRIGDEAKFGSDPSVISASEYSPIFNWGPLNGIKYIGRALVAADAYFGKNIENSEIFMESYNDSIKSGEAPHVAAKRAMGLIGFVTDGTNEAYNKAAKRADELGLKGVDREMNISIDMMNAIDPEMVEKAKSARAVETFNDSNSEGIVGAMADALRHLSWFPPTYYLGMFARIGANVFNYGVQTSPIGLVSLAIDSTIGTYKHGSKDGGITNRYVVRGKEFYKRLNRGVWSLAVTGGALAMCLQALKDYEDEDDTKKKLKFMIVGAGPTDPRLKKAWRQQHNPYVVIINGKEYPYKWWGPIASTLAFVGTLMDERRFGNMKDVEAGSEREESKWSELIPTLMYGLTTISTDELPGQGMIELADLVYSRGESAEQRLNSWERFVQKQAASIGTSMIPYSGFIRWLDRIRDPVAYAAKNEDGISFYTYSFLRNVPFVREAALNPIRGVFGEPVAVIDKWQDMSLAERAVRVSFARFIDNHKEDQDYQFLIRAKRPFNAPTKDETRLITVENGKYGLRNMNAKEYDRFIELFGGELRTQIARIRQDYSSSAELEKHVHPDNKVLKKRMESARDSAMKWAMYKYLQEPGDRITTQKEK